MLTAGVLSAGLMSLGASNLVPLPKQMEAGSGQFVLAPNAKVIGDRDVATDVRAVAKALGLGIGRSGGQIRLVRDRSIQNPEGYRLVVKSDGVQIASSGAAGFFYAAQTLRQLMPASALASTKRSEAVTVPAVTITDEPRFGWRGLMLDTARHFRNKHEIKKLLDVMALHKLNSFHWHLTDDQGWRIEIKRYPKLTSVGSMRSETMSGHYQNQKFDGKPHGGFYSQDDIREIVRYAQERHITVVPEIEMPGHAQAAIAAYPELGNTGKQLEVGKVWGVIENVFSPEDSTITFLQNVLAEVIELFPSKFIHIGGDECPKTQWKQSARAQALMKERGLHDEEELQSWFVNQMDKWLAARGRRLVGWDEILEGGLAPGATVMSWRGMRGGIAAAKAGHDVVMAPTDFTYLDYYQAPSAGEPLAIGGLLTLQKVYSFEPVPAELPAESQKHILGGQGQIWTEYIPSARKMQYMAFPRACALAEVLWSPKSSRDWDGFSSRLPGHLERLSALGVNYRRLEH